MRLYTSRNLAKIVLAIYFVFNVCLVFSRGAFACDISKLEMQITGQEAVLQAYINERDALEAEGYWETCIRP